MQIATEVTFGPVAGLSIFETEKEVMALANHTPVGLAGYFYSRDVSRIYRVEEALDVEYTPSIRCVGAKLLAVEFLGGCLDHVSAVCHVISSDSSVRVCAEVFVTNPQVFYM